MSQTTIFVIGIVIFAITVYGTVMAGGFALTRLEARENESADDRGVGAEGSAANTEDRPEI